MFVVHHESLGGNKYFANFINNASRKVWLYFLKTKEQVFKYFQQFHAMVESETEKKLKCLRTNNGGEYTSKALFGKALHKEIVEAFE